MLLASGSTERQLIIDDLSRLFPDWWSDAACGRSDTSIFFGSGNRPSNVTRARELCRSCPVLKDCLNHALTHPEEYGVWAGTSVLDRASMREQMANGDDILTVLRLHVRAKLKWSDRERR